jgi:hypothetical protein
MVTVGSRELRCVYEIADHSRKIIYIGLTFNLVKRTRGHRSNPKMVEIFGKDLKLSQISPFVPKIQAAQLELLNVSHYRLMTDYRVVNRIKTGGFGGSEVKWSNKSLLEEAQGYETVVSFRNEKPHVYAQIHRRGILPKLNEILIRAYCEPGFRDFDACQKEALKYKTRLDFKIGSSRYYNAACEKGWLKEITQHMPIRGPNRITQQP